MVSQRFPQIIEDFDQQINRISIVIGDILPIVIHLMYDNANPTNRNPKTSGLTEVLNA